MGGGRTLIGGTGYSIQSGKTLINGTAYTISFGTPISSLAVGSSVYANVNGTRTEFLVVHKGNPATDTYDSSCDGIWCLMKDIYEKRVLNSDNIKDYAASSIHSYLNNNFLSLFDTKISTLIKQVKIPYSIYEDYTLEKGLSAKIFLLCCRETGYYTIHDSRVPWDGAILDYFIEGDTDEAKNKRIAYYKGTATEWWTRSKSSKSSSTAWFATTTWGGFQLQGAYNEYGIRPTFILPSTAKIDANNNIIG